MCVLVRVYVQPITPVAWINRFYMSTVRFLCTGEKDTVKCIFPGNPFTLSRTLELFQLALQEITKVFGDKRG